MFARILVPADLTDRNRVSAEMAAGLAAPGGRVFLLHAIETIPGIDLQEEKTFYAKLERNAERHLKALGSVFEERGLQWNAEVAYGPRVKTILGEADRQKADLIVIRSHRVADDASSKGWGTLSYQIGILADCHVLLVK